MSLFQKLISSLREDSLIRRVLRNSGYLFSGNVISAVLGFVQGIFVVRLLGIEQFGLASAVMIFASNINRLFSFRMSEVTVRYMGEALTHNRKDRAAALARWIGTAEAVTSLLAYLVLYILAPWFSKDPAVTSLCRFYGLYLIANIVYETSTGVLRVTDHFRRVGLANSVQGIVTAIGIFAAFLMRWGMFEILAAYLLGKFVAALLVTASAFQELRRSLGNDWIHAPAHLMPDWKSIASFAVNTNINGTVNLFARDNIPLYIQHLSGDTALGYFSLAMKLITLVTLPIDPLIAPTYTEVNRTIVRRQWQTTRRLLKQVSVIGGAWFLLAGGGLAGLGWWFIPAVYGAESAPAYACVLVLLAGYGMGSVMNWNRPLLLALGRPNDPLVVAAVAGALEIILIFLLTPRGGYLVAAAISSAYLVVIVLVNVLRGLSIIKHNEVTA
jgi:O-antigen/teichoic acid export membrane protein